MPDRTLRELCQEAIDIQNASNLSGLVHAFSRAVSDLRLLFPNEDTDFFNKHPVVTLWLDKLCDFNGRCLTCSKDQHMYAEAYNKVSMLASGGQSNENN